MPARIPRAWRQTAGMFVALGDPHRQRILLMFEPGERLNVGQIVAASTLSRSAVAHHLAVLRDAGVLQVARRSARKSGTGPIPAPCATRSTRCSSISTRICERAVSRPQPCRHHR